MDNIAVGKFVNLILEDVHGCLINHQCAAMSPTDLSSAPAFCSDSSVFAKNLLLSLQPHLNKFDRCECVDDYSELKYRDIREFIIQKGDNSGVTWFCDMGEQEIPSLEPHSSQRVSIPFRGLHEKSSLSITSFE